RGFVPVDRKSRALRIHRAAGNRNHVAAGELGHQLHVLRHLSFGSRLFFVGMNVLAGDTGDTHWKFRVPRSQHERMQTMRDQIAQQPGTIAEVFAPAVEMFGTDGTAVWPGGIEFLARLAWSQPVLPLNGLSSRLPVDIIVP